MSTVKKKGLLEEAIFEASTIKKIALDNAKKALNESYDGYLKEKISEKLDNMNEEDSMDDDEVDLNELLSEIDEEDGEFPTEVPTEVGAEDEMTGMTDGDADKAISEMTSEELIALIRDAVSQELNGGDEVPAEGEIPTEGEGIDDGSGMDVTDDEEIDLDELLNEVDEQLQTAPVQVAPSTQNFSQLRSENTQLKSQLAEAKKAISIYKNVITESKLFASKSNALAKVLSKTNLSESQKQKVASRFDAAKNEREVELIYNTLKESIGKMSTVKSKPIASKIVGSTKTTLTESSKSIIGESMKSRLQELAGITKGTRF